LIGEEGKRRKGEKEKGRRGHVGKGEFHFSSFLHTFSIFKTYF
jgi:hypothetical protein